MKLTCGVTQAIQQYFAVLGMDVNAQNRSNPFNVRSVIANCVFCSSAILTSGYLLTEAETIEEYIDSVSITTATIIDTFIYLSFFYRLSKFSKFVNSLEETFQERMCCGFVD